MTLSLLQPVQDSWDACGDLAVEAIEAARRAGGRVILRVHVPLVASDPWAWARRVAIAGERAMLWHEPGADRTLAAGGDAISLELDGPGRLETASGACALIARQLLDRSLPGGYAPTPGAPLAWVGLAFRERPSGPDSPWAGWPAGRVWVPRRLVYRLAGHTALAVTEPVEPQTDPVRLARSLTAAVNLAASPAPGPPPAHAPRVPVEDDAPGAREAWRARVEMALDAFGADDPPLAKVVLSRPVSFTAPAGTRFDAAATARRLRDRHPSCTTFAVSQPDGSAFVGATPELLISVRGQRARAAALAGTIPRGAGEDDEARGRALIARAKDRHEHRLVVQAVADALAPLAATLEIAETPSVRRLADVQHLETLVSARLRADLPHGPARILSLADRLHPTPAVAGAPRAAALDWLTAHESYDRGWYAGVLGWLDARGDGALHVALRSALLRPRRAWAFAGAGLVPGSDPAAEWEETQHKLAALRQALALVADAER